MAGRRAISSPIFYSALLACGLIGLYYGVELASPLVRKWVEQWRLSQSLRSADARARLGTVLLMAQKDPALTTPYLIKATGDADVEVRVAACRVLASRANHGPLLLSTLSRAADDAREEVRAEVARILGRIVAGSTVREKQGQASRPPPAPDITTEAAALLDRLLKDPKGDVRAAAAEALGEGGPGPAPRELVAAAADADRGVRLAVARSLLRRNGPDDPTLARLLCELIADPGPIADRFQILRMVQGTTRETQDRALRSLADLIPHVDSAILPDVIACLGESGPLARSALPVLEKLLDAPEPSTRASATMAVLAIDEKPTPRILSALLEMIASKDLPQDWRMDALGRIREAKPASLASVTPALIRQLGDKSPDIRRSALELLSAIIEDTPAEMPAATGGK